MHRRDARPDPALAGQRARDRAVAGVTTIRTCYVRRDAGLLANAAGWGTVYVYSPVTSTSWYYTNLDHPGYLGSTSHDVGGINTGWTGSSDVTFNASTQGAVSLQAFVQRATVNCTSGGPDNWVRLNVYSDGVYRGDLAYVHLRTLSVAENTWISPNTILGTIQNAPSCCASDGGTCWTGIHMHMENTGGTWTSSAVNQQQPYSTPVVTFVVGPCPCRPQPAPTVSSGPVK